MLNSGSYLRVNLTTGEVKKEGIREEDARRYFLGSGYAAMLYAREMDPNVDALEAENSLYIFNGLTTGSILPTACRVSFCGRSPLTGIWNESNLGGHFGAELRKAGLDGLVITGKADQPVYLFVHDGEVEVRSAKHLWGLDTFDTYDQLIQETHPKARAAVIGPAGENLVLFAAVLQGGRTHTRAAGRGGMGAVLGSKLVKGIVAYGKEKVEAADPKQFHTLVKQQNPVIQSKTVGLSKFGTAGGVAGAEAIGDLPIHNYLVGNWPDGAENISGQSMAEQHSVKQTFCFACPIGCGKRVDAVLKDGSNIQGEGPEYETLAGLGAMLEIDDLDTMLKANDYCNRMGIDTISASATAAFAFEAFENGLIQIEDCDQQPLEWGNPDSLMVCLKLMVERRGVGEILSSGSRAAAKHLKNQSELYAMHVKGLELAYHDPRATFSMAANYATANRGGCHLEGLSYWAIYGLDASPWSPRKVDRFSNEDAAQEAVDFQNYFSTYNPLGICKFIGKASPSPQLLGDLINAATGWDITDEELLETGERIFNLKRIINNHLGISRKDDDLPIRLKTFARPTGGSKGKLPDLEIILNDYYALRGWTEQGQPNQETITRLELTSFLE
ncbi:MAG: aldehyde ferredoxin oxidoreductase family protein [Anaerolineaceae bacterium]|nr:aldehyde ferredoxin oxidoreductase family protein [Anaerolineaceae bacterium]